MKLNFQIIWTLLAGEVSGGGSLGSFETFASWRYSRVSFLWSVRVSEIVAYDNFGQRCIYQSIRPERVHLVKSPLFQSLTEIPGHPYNKTSSLANLQFCSRKGLCQSKITNYISLHGNSVLNRIILKDMRNLCPIFVKATIISLIAHTTTVAIAIISYLRILQLDCF